MDTENKREVLRFTAEELGTYLRAILKAVGSTDNEAAIVAAEVVDAEASGYPSQGLIRVPAYLGAVKSGRIRPGAELTLLRDAPTAMAWDAGFGWGHVAALHVTEVCAKRAAETGACFAVIRNVGHIGRLGHYVEAGCAHQVVSMIACSATPAGALMAPWGGREARLSTNPLAIGFPYDDRDPIVVDISTTQVARGQILVAGARGEAIPDDWALDAAGLPTTDPAQALPPNGTLAPLGGHKGYALAVAVELLCGALSGSYPPDEASVFVAAFGISSVTTLDEYRAAVRDMDELIHSSALRPGFDEIRLPGAGAADRRRASDETGIEIEPEIWHSLEQAAEAVGVRFRA